MSEITPPPPPAPPPTPAAPRPTAAIPNPPAALLKELSLGARLDAVITGTTPRGLIEIETLFGRIALQTKFPLPPGGPLQLQLTAKGPAALFLITAIHGLPPQAALRSLGLLASPSAKSGAVAGKAATGGKGAGAPSPAGPARGAAAITVTGTGPPGAPGTAPATSGGTPALGNLTVGATLAATLLKAGPAQPTATGGPAPTGAGTAIHGAKAGPAGAPASAAGTPQVAASSSLPPGTLFSLRITAFQPAAPGTSPGAGAVPAPPPGGSLSPGGAISGVVIGQASPSGHPIVLTHAGSLTVATLNPVAAGSTITFEVLSQSPPAASPAVHPGAHTSPVAQLLGGRWPGLGEAVRTLEEINPAAAQQLIQAVLPRPGLTLAANMLFFLAALTGGDLRGWLGDGPARILQKNRPDLFARLRDDFGRLRTIADEPRAGDWRTILIPFQGGAEIEQIRLFMRKAGEQAEDDEEEGRKGTRFVVELNFTHLGRFQLDGLVYEKEKHLDLIVRTQSSLPRKMQNDIRDIFENANSVTGLKGGIVFQAAPPNFIEVEGLEPEPENLGLIV